ncbi:M67 family metallopeptidase [Erythrobacter sp. WH158]|uniref:M67 family metallopeptidase n=2 Tax=Erythrobacter crassostreae TaxID=2828328 RepID=A0A9X1F396_9SPHN|nr:M67 family metallopeptidase [Erythrobacter crassostrea]
MQSAAKAAHPLECCGILLGEGGCITGVIETLNVHPTPQTHFEIDPQALIDAHKAERKGGLRLMGYFHSHPTGDAYPSETDKKMATHDGKVWAIIAGGGMMFWTDDKDGFHALSYDVGSR